MTLSDQVSKRVEKSLQTKLKAHREKVGDDKRKQTTLRKLKICFNRGIGAYRNNPSSVRPTVTSPEQWAQARVNSFLYALRNLRYRSGKHDTDLLPKSHPQAGKEKKASSKFADEKIQYVVTVSEGTNSYGKGNKFYLDGELSPGLTMEETNEYKFDISDPSNKTHALRFSQTNDGTHNEGEPYEEQVKVEGKAGEPGAFISIKITSETPNLSYYCVNHPGMGNDISIIKSEELQKRYPDGEAKPESLPDSYRPAAKQGETKGQACINCDHYEEDHKTEDETHRFYCKNWKAKIRPQYWCAAWKAIKTAQKFERTYNDYPQTATDNAKKVLRWRDEHPDEIKGMTAIGWRRAGQLARREKLSRNTIARMASFKRHQKNAEIDPKFEGTPWKDAGYVAWLGWGGTSGVNWAIRKLEQIDKEAKSKMEKKFAFGVVGMEETNVDREKGTMEGVSLISEGPALGHQLFVDKKSIETIDDQLDDTKLPAYITHRGALFEDRLTREIGMFTNFRIQGDRLLGDFEAFESFREDDNKKFNRLFEMAEKIPERFGLSIVFSATSAWATPDGDYEADDKPEDALFEFPSIRVEEITSADFVDSPAANQRGLFSKIDNKPVYKMTKAELIKKNEELEAEMAELAECVEQFTQAAKLSEDEDKELGGHEDDELGGHEDEEEKEAAESLEEENAKLKSEIEELKQKLAEEEEKMAELQSELDGHKEKEMKKDEELADAASQLSAKNDEISTKESRIIELQAIVKGSEAVKFSKEDGDYSPSQSNRAQLIAQYAKDHNISEFSATLKLGKEKPEIFNI